MYQNVPPIGVQHSGLADILRQGGKLNRVQKQNGLRHIEIT